MTVYLARRGCHYSAVTVHKYMNTEMRLYSPVRPKKPGYQRGKPHKIFENRLQREFQADRGEPQAVYGFHIPVFEKRGSALQLQHCQLV